MMPINTEKLLEILSKRTWPETQFCILNAAEAKTISDLLIAANALYWACAGAPLTAKQWHFIKKPMTDFAEAHVLGEAEDSAAVTLIRRDEFFRDAAQHD